MIKQLNLHLINDVIRAKGRIIISELPLDATTPLFLPNKSHLVDLLINHIHSSHHHVGLSQTLSLYRQRCWTPKIRSRVKSLLLRCVTCQRIKGRTLPRPLPPPLPAERVQWVAPFTHVGVDHTGSFNIKDTQRRKTKAYICLFVCATTRAVHLEVVDNLTAASFTMCLRRLAAAKRMPTLILSDNHSGGDLPARHAAGSFGTRVSSKQERAVEASNAQVTMDGRTLREAGQNH